MYIDALKYKKRLAKKGIKTSHLIKVCMVSRQTFYDYINGKKEAPNDFILRLANELVCPIMYLKK